MKENILQNKYVREFGHKLRYYLTRNHYSTLLIHLFLMLVVVAFCIYSFFFIFLPLTTNHDRTIKVPDINKMKINQVEQFLKDRDLRYYVADTSYNPKYPPLSVLQQNPEPNASVKIHRKIYVTINSENPPDTRIPQVIDYPYHSAVTQLRNAKLKIGKKEYVDNPLRNVVLKIVIKGKEYTKQQLKKGVFITQGTPVDLYIATGNKDNSFSMPKMVGRFGEDAKIELEGNGLRVKVHYEKAEGKAIGSVVSQKPAYGRKVVAGQTVHLWFASAETE